MAAKSKSRDPMKTRNDRVRLGPLSITQLEELFIKSGKKKEQAKIQKRLSTLVIRNTNNFIKKMNKDNKDTVNNNS